MARRAIITARHQYEMLEPWLRYATFDQKYVDKLYDEFWDWFQNTDTPVDDESEAAAEYGPLGVWPNIESFLKERYPAAYGDWDMGLEDASPMVDTYETGPDAIAQYGYDPKEVGAAMVLHHNEAHGAGAREQDIMRDKDRLTDIFQKRQKMQRDFEQRTKQPALATAARHFATFDQDLVDNLDMEFHDWYADSGTNLDPTPRGPIGNWKSIERFLKDRYPAANKDFAFGFENAAQALDRADVIKANPTAYPHLKGKTYETGPQAIEQYGYDPAEIAASMVLLHNQSHPGRSAIGMGEKDQQRLVDIFNKREQMQRDFDNMKMQNDYDQKQLVNAALSERTAWSTLPPDPEEHWHLNLPDKIPHGSIAGFTSYGCRCPACTYVWDKAVGREPVTAKTIRVANQPFDLEGLKNDILALHPGAHVEGLNNYDFSDPQDVKYAIADWAGLDLTPQEWEEIGEDPDRGIADYTQMLDIFNKYLPENLRQTPRAQQMHENPARGMADYDDPSALYDDEINEAGYSYGDGTNVNDPDPYQALLDRTQRTEFPTGEPSEAYVNAFRDSSFRSWFNSLSPDEQARCAENPLRTHIQHQQYVQDHEDDDMWGSPGDYSPYTPPPVDPSATPTNPKARLRSPWSHKIIHYTPNRPVPQSSSAYYDFDFSPNRYDVNHEKNYGMYQINHPRRPMDEPPIGYLQYHTVDPDPYGYGPSSPTIHVDLLNTHPHYRLHGVGAALMQALAEDYPNHKIDPGYTTEHGTGFVNYMRQNAPGANERLDLSNWDASAPNTVTPEQMKEWGVKDKKSPVFAYRTIHEAYKAIRAFRLAC